MNSKAKGIVSAKPLCTSAVARNHDIYQDGFLTQFQGTVLECTEEKDGWAIVLDRTAFYPEGDSAFLLRYSSVSSAAGEGNTT